MDGHGAPPARHPLEDAMPHKSRLGCVRVNGYRGKERRYGAGGHPVRVRIRVTKVRLGLAWITSVADRTRMRRTGGGKEVGGHPGYGWISTVDPMSLPP